MNALGGDPYYNASTHGNNEFLSKSDYIATKVLTGIDFRAKNIESFDSIEENSIDLYASLKSLYLQDRKKKISNSKGSVETQTDSDWEEIDFD
jgi:phospholipid-binding lipoprotein MlaA